MQTVIGLAGKKSAGKGTVARILCKIFGEHVDHFRSSDILTATLDLWDLEHTRDNYSALPVAMEHAYGKGILTRVMHKKIAASRHPYVIFDGVRWETDVKMIREFPQNMLWYITAPLEIKHQRARLRAEKADEKEITLEKFIEQESAKTETYLPVIKTLADVIITNDGTLADLEEMVARHLFIQSSFFKTVPMQ